MNVKFIVNKHFQVSYGNVRGHNRFVNSVFTEGM